MKAQTLHLGSGWCMSPDAEAAYYVLRADKQNVGHESGLHLQSAHPGEAEIILLCLPSGRTMCAA